MTVTMRFSILILFSQLVLLEALLAGVEEERLLLRGDVKESSLGKETLIKHAWTRRDAAVGRKNLAEVELARGRIEGMQVRGQSDGWVGNNCQQKNCQP